MTRVFVLNDGTRLKLKPVNPDAIRNLIADRDMSVLIERWAAIGGDDGGVDATALEREIDASTLLKINQATTRLFNYCIGFGVDHTPPQSELDELKAMGFPVDSPRVALVNWLRYLKLTGTEEAGELVGTIMALSLQQEKGQDVPLPDDETEALRARIAELEARINRNE